jgi:hypothetical protein
VDCGKVIRVFEKKTESFGKRQGEMTEVAKKRMETCGKEGGEMR